MELIGELRMTDLVLFGCQTASTNLVAYFNADLRNLGKKSLKRKSKKDTAQRTHTMGVSHPAFMHISLSLHFVEIASNIEPISFVIR